MFAQSLSVRRVFSECDRHQKKSQKNLTTKKTDTKPKGYLFSTVSEQLLFLLTFNSPCDSVFDIHCTCHRLYRGDIAQGYTLRSFYSHGEAFSYSRRLGGPL